jgi:hypothetical protein
MNFPMNVFDEEADLASQTEAELLALLIEADLTLDEVRALVALDFTNLVVN